MEVAHKEELTFIDAHGLLGSSYYFSNRSKWNITKEELAEIGIVDDRIQVHKDIISPLKVADEKFQKRDLRIFLKEGYRSPALYHLVFHKRLAKHGEKQTNRLFNIKDKPHATGKAVDVSLWNGTKGEEIITKDIGDGPEALLVGFYKDKDDPKSNHYQELQEYIINTMTSCGFHLGKLGEYFHFNYFPITDY